MLKNIEYSSSPCDLDSMTEIKERELRDNLANGAVTSIRALLTDSGYRLFIQLSWKQEEAMFISQRGDVRYFQSFDRLVKLLRTFEGKIPPIIVSIQI